MKTNQKDTETIKVTHQGLWKALDGIEIDCYVTNDRQRLMSLRAAARAMNLIGGGSGALLRNLKSLWIQPFLTDQLREWIFRASNKEIKKIKGIWGPPFIPFEASLFVDVCKAYIEAKNELEFTEKQLLITDRLLSIMTAFAKVGITSLVDEITGYQKERKDTDMQRLLSRYVNSDFLKWTKMFPDNFYKEIFRLKNWGDFEKAGQKMPQAVGMYTNDIIYNRLPKNVCKALKDKTPKSANGNNRYKLHQSLTQDEGVSHLKGHLIATMALMRASDNWDELLFVMDKSYPPQAGQLMIRFK